MDITDTDGVKEIQVAELNVKEKVALVCLYYARLKGDDPDYQSYRDKLKLLSRRYNIKFNTIKNDKDKFDSNFENDRAGWKEDLSKRKFLYEIYLKYKDVAIDALKGLVKDILLEAEQDGLVFYSIRTKHPDTVASILRKESGIEIEGINILKDELSLGKTVFMVLGGDTGQSWVTWETGLIGVGVIAAPPYDIGYKDSNFKIKIDMRVLLKRPIKREQLIGYQDTYNIIGIGPTTKWEPNQAISRIPEYKAVALMRAMLDLSPEVEEDLINTVEAQLMERIKGSAVILLPREIEYGEDVLSEATFADTEDRPEATDAFQDVYDPDISLVLEDYVMQEAPIKSLKNFINSQKHIIIIGPPGTGKTAIAERLCKEAVRLKYVSGYTITTAVSDWSTFDTIGGYMPNQDGKLLFEEGIFLKSLRNNNWLLIDEINRAEIDKAFGPFFTVLSGRDVELQHKADVADGTKSIAIRHSANRGSGYNGETGNYTVGKNWRIIATMNTYDKNSLFVMSYAFMRRFAFIYIPTPDDNEFSKLIRERLDGQDDLSKSILEITKFSPKKLGAAIILDLIDYLKETEHDGLAEGICSLIIPQYEGLTLPQIKQLYKDFCKILNTEDKNFLQNYLCEFYDIKTSDLAKINTEVIDAADDEDILFPDA